MRRVIVTITILSALLLFSAQLCLAVDGYKQFKFKMSKDQVVEVLKEHKLSAVTDESKFTFAQNLGEEAVECHRFPFGGTFVQVKFAFIADKLVKIVVRVPDELVGAVYFALNKKYGKDAFQNPKREDLHYFENNTVELMWAGPDTEEGGLLFYQMPGYAKLLSDTKKKFKLVMDDI